MADGSNRVSKPSVWPARSCRRHAATLEFNEQVLTALAQITSRLEKVEAILSAPCGPKLSIGSSDEETRIVEAKAVERNVLDDLSSRIERMELLLFRLPVQDYSDLDSKISSLMPDLAPRYSSLADEPEKEKSPEKFQDASSVHTYPPNCLVFNMAAHDDMCTQLANRQCSRSTDGILPSYGWSAIHVSFCTPQPLTTRNPTGRSDLTTVVP